MRAARAGAAWASISASRVWMSAMRCGSLARLGLGEQRRALLVGGEHEVDQRLRAAGRLLLDAAEPRARGTLIEPLSAGFRRAIRRNSVVLPAPLRPTRPTRAPGRQRGGRAVDQQALAEAVGEVVDVKHGGLFARHASGCKIVSVEH